MNGWAQVNGWATLSPTSQVWHQVEFDSRTNTAVVACSGDRVDIDAEDVMDYRWLPPGQRRCPDRVCQAMVEA